MSLPPPLVVELLPLLPDVSLPLPLFVELLLLVLWLLLPLRPRDLELSRAPDICAWSPVGVWVFVLVCWFLCRLVCCGVCCFLWFGFLGIFCRGVVVGFGFCFGLDVGM